MRYRYYVSRDLQHSGDASSSEGWRLPAREIEPLIRARIIALLNDPVEVLARSGGDTPSADQLKAIIELGKSAAVRLTGPRAAGAKLLRDLVAEVRLGTDRISIVLSPVKLGSLLAFNLSAEAVKLDVAARLNRRGGV